MRATTSLARWCWATCVFGSLGLYAQDAGFTQDAKIRLGSSLVKKDELRASAMGVGLNLGFTTAVGKVGFELGYFYKAGDPYVVPMHGMAPSEAELSPVENVGDSRQNQLDGFSLRFSLQRKLSEVWDWQVGLMLGGTRFKHQYVGDIKSENWNSTNVHSWRDTYTGTPREGGIKVSPYAGVTWAVDKDSSLEFNVLVLNYTALEYVHKAGSGTYVFEDDSHGRIAPLNGFSADSLLKHNRLVPHVEIAYVFHF